MNYSRQREAIRNCLINRYDHPTAEAVYESVRIEYPKISLGTVYRNLSVLVELGQAIKISCGDGFEHFDGNVMPHTHFYCSKCARLIDLDMNNDEAIKALEQAAMKNFAGKINSTSVVFTGICEECVNQ